MHSNSVAVCDNLNYFLISNCSKGLYVHFLACRPQPRWRRDCWKLLPTVLQTAPSRWLMECWVSSSTSWSSWSVTVWRSPRKVWLHLATLLSFRRSWKSCFMRWGCGVCDLSRGTNKWIFKKMWTIQYIWCRTLGEQFGGEKIVELDFYCSHFVPSPSGFPIAYTPDKQNSTD